MSVLSYIQTYKSIFQRSIRIIREEGIKKFTFRAFKWLKAYRGEVYILFLPYLLIKVNRFKPKSIDDGIRFVYDSFCGLLSPMQIKSEIAELLKIFVKHKPKIIVEIGTARGGTLFLFTKFAPKNAKIISIDLPGHIFFSVPFRGRYPKWKTLLFKAFKRGKQKMFLLKMDSHDRKTLEKVRKILGRKKIDFLFIDGDHTYEGVKKDFEMYSSLVRKGGIIAFHDIVPGFPEIGVTRFWNETKKRYKYLEIIEDRNQYGYGIGVLLGLTKLSYY